MNRRTFIGQTALAGAGLLVATDALAAGDTFSWEEKTTELYQLPKLPYEYNALEPYFDAATMEIHHSKHHAAYVKKLNEALNRHADHAKTPLETLFEQMNNLPPDLKNDLRNHGGGHWNHTLFWSLLSPQPNLAKPEAVEQALTRHFGSVAQFQTQFSDAAKGVFGSGWAWLVKKADGSLAITATPNQDNPLMAGATVPGKPLLALDVWEHAYYLKHQNRRPDYIAAFWNIVNWPKVGQLLAQK